MKDNIASVFGNIIYNNGNMSILNLIYLKNITYNVSNGNNVPLYVYLTNDMSNLVAGQNISFYVDRVLIGTIKSIEGYAEFNYAVIGEDGDIFQVNGSYDRIGNFNIIINEGQLRIVKIATNTTTNAPNTKVDESITIISTLKIKIEIF